jgi:hypothetical protein
MDSNGVTQNYNVFLKVTKACTPETSPTPR